MTWRAGSHKAWTTPKDARSQAMADADRQMHRLQTVELDEESLEDESLDHHQLSPPYDRRLGQKNPDST